MKLAGSILLIAGFLLVWAEQTISGTWWKFGLIDFYVGFDAVAFSGPLSGDRRWICQYWLIGQREFDCGTFTRTHSI